MSLVNVKAPRAFLEAAFRLMKAETDRNNAKPWLEPLNNIKITAVFSEPDSISVYARIPTQEVFQAGITKLYAKDWIEDGQNTAPMNLFLAASLSYQYMGLKVVDRTESSGSKLIYKISFPTKWGIEPLPLDESIEVPETVEYPWNITVSERDADGFVTVSALLPLQWAMTGNGGINCQTTDTLL
jgi:hypothetical protein